MRNKALYLLIISLIILGTAIIYADQIANIIFFRRVVLKPTPTTPAAEVVRLEYGDVVEVFIRRIDNNSPLLFTIRAYNIKLNPGSEFNPALVRYIPIVSLRPLEDSYNTTIHVERTANYAVEIYNEGENMSSVEVVIKPITLESWTYRIRFILAIPFILLILYLLALYIEK